MIVSEHEQNTEGWKLDRLGCPSSSEFKRIITSKGVRSKSRQGYMDELAAEIITGEFSEKPKLKAFDLGHEREQENIDLYIFKNKKRIEKTEKVGFCWKDKKKLFGSSPDLLVNGDGLMEAKNAKGSVQIARLRSWTASEHFGQAHGQMLVTRRKWVDVVSYCRGMKTVTVRFERDEEFLRKLEVELIMFHKDLYELVRSIQA